MLNIDYLYHTYCDRSVTVGIRAETPGPDPYQNILDPWNCSLQFSWSPSLLENSVLGFYVFVTVLRIRSIFGRIWILQIRILKTGSGFRILFFKKLTFFPVPHIFLAWFMTKKFKNATWNIGRYTIFYSSDISLLIFLPKENKKIEIWKSSIYK